MTDIFFEQAYGESLKAKQVKATWWGFLVVCGLSFCWLLFWLLLAFSTASI